MDKAVTAQVALLGKTLTADLTLIVLLLCMHKAVAVEVTILLEAFATYVTFKFLLTVHQHVAVEVAYHIEAPPTQHTLKLLLIMHQHVTVEMAFHVETLSAQHALVLPLCAVYKHVTVKMCLQKE